MICSKCGKEVSEYASKCSNCGAKIEHKKDGNKIRNVIWISLAATFVVFFLIFIITGFSITSYSNVATKYMEKMAQNDHKDAYNYLAVDDSVFMTKAQFIAKESVVNDIVSADSVSQAVRSIGKKAINYVTAKFTDTKYTVVDKCKSGDYAKVTLKAKSGNSLFNSITTEQTVYLKRCGNHLLIFPNWKVVDEDVMATNVTMHIPESDKVYIDGIEMPQDYIEGDDGSYVEYVIPSLYKGSHVCSVKYDDKTIKNYNFNVNKSDTSITIGDIELTKEQQVEVINKAAESFRTIIEAQNEGRDFEAISGTFADGSKAATKESYDNGKKFFFKDNGYVGISGVEISNMTGSVVDAAFSDDTLEVTVDLTFTDTNKGKINTIIAGYLQGSDDSNECTQRISMEYVDGKWVVSSLGTNNVINNILFFNMLF